MDIQYCNYIEISTLQSEYNFKNVKQITIFNEYDTNFISFYDENNNYFIFKLSDVVFIAKVKHDPFDEKHDPFDEKEYN